MVSPCLSVPCLSAPPRTPPSIFSGVVPGLLMSKLRATNICGG